MVAGSYHFYFLLSIPWRHSSCSLNVGGRKKEEEKGILDWSPGKWTNTCQGDQKMESATTGWWPCSEVEGMCGQGWTDFD